MEQKGLLHLPRFRAWLFDQGRMALEKRNPQYVNVFRRGIVEGKTLEENIPETKPLLRSSIQPWPDLLEAELQLERRLERLRHSLSLLAKVPSDDLLSSWGLTQGAWLFYHIDCWYIGAFSFLECWDKLFKMVCRRLLKGEDRSIVEEQLVPVLSRLRANIEYYRNAEAHTTGGGVEDMGSEGLWEPILMALDAWEDVQEKRYESTLPYHACWHAILRQRTTDMIAQLEASFERLGRILYKDA